MGVSLMDPSLVDDIINRLFAGGGYPGSQIQVSKSEVGQLCAASKDIFMKQPCLLELSSPIKIAGDIHGQYSDLLRLFKKTGFPPQVNYLFLGNYVDFGKQSLEAICLLLAYKIKYPQNFFLLRGNHECASINRIHGFYEDCKMHLNERLWKTFNDCFNCLPIAAVIDDKVFCVHGGLSPDLHELDEIRRIERPTDVPDSGLLCDLLWSDPSREVRGWGMNNNDHGVSYTFDADKVTKFLQRHDLVLICRGHQVVDDGYKFFADGKLVTVFSAPDYRGEYDNAGAIMSLDESLMRSFHTLNNGDLFNVLSQDNIQGRLLDLSVDDIIRRLCEVGEQSSFQVVISEVEIFRLCVMSSYIFREEPSLLQLKSPITIVGDIHGQYFDLLRLFESGGYPPEQSYLFLGNYVDFGSQSVETICLLLALKVRYPDKIFLLRGNHEDAKMNRVHGFYDECKTRFNVRLWKNFNECFNYLPIAAVIEDRIFCIHGGLSPHLHELDQIRGIQRPTDIPDGGLLFDLLWSMPNNVGWGEAVTDDSISVITFGIDKVQKFLDKNDLHLICRGHQVVEGGYEFFADKGLVTLFSAPNFRGEYDNTGAILKVDESLVCSFDTFKPTERISLITKLSNGSSSYTITVNPSMSKAVASKKRSVSPGFMPDERMSKSNIGGNSFTANPESSEEVRPFEIDPATLYRSKSPGVKRFLGAGV